MQIKSNLSVKVIVIGILLIFCFAPSRAQETKSESSQTQKTQELTHEVSVTLKLIQVYVTDPKGNPALDLEKSDFVIYDNGKLQIITDFEKHFFLTPEVKLEETKPFPARDMTSVIKRKFIFLFDYESNDFEGIAKSRTAALQFIKTEAQQGDEIALISYSFENGLTLHEYFTSDFKIIQAAIEKIRELPGIIEGWGSWRALGHSVMGMESFRPSSSRIKDNLGKSRIFSSNIQNLAKALRYIPGPKNIILFSRGYGDGVLKPKTPNGEAFLAMSKELASANCPVFAINTVSGIGKIRVLPEDALDYLSKLTGGKYFHDVNYESKIATDIQSATSTYYVLGYSIGATQDGQFRDIKVVVKRAGYEVFAQKGYFNPKHFSKYTKVEKDLHLFDLALSESPLFQTPINMPMTALPLSIENEPGICLLARIPGEKIREKIGKDAEIYFLVFDEKDNIIELKQTAVEQSALKGKDSLYYSLLPLQSGTYKTSIVMRDTQTGESAVGQYRVEIPDTQEHGLKLLPPLLLARGKTDLYVQGYVPKFLKGNFPLLDNFPFDPELYSPILGEIPQDTQKIQALLRCSMRNLTKPMMKFEADLIENSSAQKNSLLVLILSGEKEDQVGTLLVEFEMPELRPGEYILRITAIDITSQTRSQTTIALNVY